MLRKWSASNTSIHMHAWEGNEYEFKSMIDLIVCDERLKTLGKDIKLMRNLKVEQTIIW